MEQKQISNEEIFKVLLELKAKMNKMDQYIEDLELTSPEEHARIREEKMKMKNV